jgi:hypothetical protein
MMRISLTALALLASASIPASADVLIHVDQSAQRMSVAVNGAPVYDWVISTGKPGNDTPNGDFRPNRMDADHHSDEYNQAPMPHAIFFDLKGHAIHGTFEKIGKPGASHGCVRLSPQHAAALFALVEKQGMAKTRVEIEGDVKIALRAVGGNKVARAGARAPLQLHADTDEQDEALEAPVASAAASRPGRQQYGAQAYGDPRASDDSQYGYGLSADQQGGNRGGFYEQPAPLYRWR